MSKNTANPVKPVPVVERETVLGPVLAVAKINSDAERKSFLEDGKKVFYWLCNRYISGGVVEMYVFGDVVPGKKSSLSVEVKTRLVKGKLVHYLRAQAVTDGERPKHRLYVGGSNDLNAQLDFAMPSLAINDDNRHAFIGFIQI